ncbi:MOSC domain-containing protein [Natranaerovirga pectinivora]|uniref:MOSC domain-containing protein n=1 Tax=Natranaerovirga pectinivora TaxID=682400 RepID=A0A4R3MND4_9FIRM|nr:MOSC domain-containing protein [Natranaerovirga pectinivora]TCT16731.1 MOSC domain-containing protein [Natranaerovirga pectinivora]
MKERIGKVISINYSDKKGILKTPTHQGIFKENFGLLNDAHGGAPIRQVSLLAKESIEKMEKELGKKLPLGSFAENLTIEGIELFTLPIGTKMIIGDTIQEVSQIGKKCHSACEIGKQVGKCIMPIEGIFTIVNKGGTVKVGDVITIVEA